MIAAAVGRDRIGLLLVGGAERVVDECHDADQGVVAAKPGLGEQVHGAPDRLGHLVVGHVGGREQACAFAAGAHGAAKRARHVEQVAPPFARRAQRHHGACEQMRRHAVDDLGLAAEVPVQRGVGDAQPRSDPAHREAVEADLVEDIERNGDHPRLIQGGSLGHRAPR